MRGHDGQEDMAADETKKDATGERSRSAPVNPVAGETSPGPGRAIARVLEKRAVVVRRIDLAKARLGEGARMFHDRAGPVAEQTTALVKRRSSEAVVWLKRFNRENAAPRASNFAAALKRRLHPHSIGRDYRRALLRCHELFFGRGAEKLFFVPTHGRISSIRLSIPGQVRPGAHDYRPTPYKVFSWAMATLPREEALEDFTFADFGSGRGRALLLAAHHPFEKVTGAEIARELHDDCRMNIAQYPRSPMKCRDVTCMHLRATTFPIPEGPAVLYFFNPFEMFVFEKVLARIARSYRRARRRMYLVCVDMDEAEAVAAAGIFEKVKPPLVPRIKTGLFSPYRIAVYRTAG